MASITMSAGKDFLEACRIHIRETALSYSTGADVSPMSWDGAQYVFTITSPEPAPETAAAPQPLAWSDGDTRDADDPEDDDAPEARVNQEALQSINVTDVL